MRTRLPLLSFALVLSGCASYGSNVAGGAPTSAVATVRDAGGRELGTLTLSESSSGLATSGTLYHLAPGPHGIHLHTVGRCDGSFASAGGHWNPTMHQHGFDNPMGPHVGDMQNIVAGSDSSAIVNVSTRGGILRGTNGLIDTDGAAVVVHAGPDDYRTDPAGNSGARIGCGVIR
jgi:superoxide dismutase, Cu-Zn family